MTYSEDQLFLLERLVDEFETLRDTDREERLPEWRQKVTEEFGIYKNEALRDIRLILEDRVKKIA